MISLKNIQDDLEELLEESDIQYYGDPKFDEAMLKAGLFEHGCTRRSHRYIPEKKRQLGYFGIIETLTGLKKKKFLTFGLKIQKIVEEFGYTITKI
jgi:hypothetical protein